MHERTPDAIIARVTADQRVQEMWVYLAPGIGLFFPRREPNAGA